jgi:hypothetical protein
MTGEKEAIRRIELLFDNNFYIEVLYTLHIKFELKKLWFIAFGTTLSVNDLTFIKK